MYLNSCHEAKGGGEQVQVENGEEERRGGGNPRPRQHAVQARQQQEGGECRAPEGLKQSTLEDQDRGGRDSAGRGDIWN
jgi:hypothetical protein